MLRAYLIIYVYIFEPEHCISRVNLGSMINIFAVLGLIFVSRLSFEWGDNFSFVIMQFCSVPREKCFLLHSLRSRCVRFCIIRTIEQVSLNLDYHGILMNIIFRSSKLENHGFLVDTCSKRATLL